MNRAATHHARPQASPTRTAPPRRPSGQAASPYLFAGAAGLLSVLALPGSAQSAPLRATAMQNGPGQMQNAPADARGAQAMPGRSRMLTPAMDSRINADSAPWHLDWNGATGTLTRHALGSLPELSMPLLYAHTEPGPKGYSKYLTWFLARDKDQFSIAWCYLNDSGREFYCWLYEFPTNQLTTHRFVGDYRFAPLKEPLAPTVQTGLDYRAVPLYSGPDFTYSNWTRRTGALGALTLTPTRAASFAMPPDAGASALAQLGSQMTGDTAARTLSGLRVSPLHEIHVAKGNGWRAGGWRELHALAYDSANDPYYLILYSNQAKGYALDLKRAQTFVADFGQPVTFATNTATFGASEDVIVGPPDLRVRRFARVEIPLATTTHYDNPYTQALVDVEFRNPEGQTLRIPGFWDGGQTWRARLAPTLIGTWTWRSVSSDAELNGQTGTFTCIADDTGSKGFLKVNGGLKDNHGFSYFNGQPFTPSYLREPTFNAPVSSLTVTPAPAAPSVPAPGLSAALFTGPTPAPILAQAAPSNSSAGITAIAPAPGNADAAGAPDASAASAPRSYRDFVQRVDNAVTLGFNRFWGGYVLDPVAFTQHSQANEGGAPFMDYDLDRLNPAFFQAMDQRIAYCNDRGVVPDIGLTDLSAAFASKIPPTQMSLLWRYVVARYASYNVCWNLFGTSADRPLPAGAEALVSTLALQTRRYDPNAHPITTVWPNAAPLSVAAPVKPPSGPVTFMPDRASIVPPGGLPVLRPDPNFQVPPGGTRGGLAPQQGQGGRRGATGADAGSMPQDSAGSNRGGSNRGGASQGGTSQGGTSQGGTNRGGTGRSATGAGGTSGTDASGMGRGRAGRGSQGGTGASGAGMDAADANGGGRSAGRGGTDPRGSGAAGADPNSFRGSRSDASGQGGFARRGNRRSRSAVPGADTSVTELSSDYVTIADPGVRAEVQAERAAQHPNAAFTLQPSLPLAGAAWLDAITLTGGAPASLEADYSLNKPLVLLDTTRSASPAAPDETRYRLWETAMRGGYWANGVSGDKNGAQPLDDQITQWQIACARLLSQAKVGRLSPHQDMLGGPGETQFARRRRRRAEAAAAGQIAAQKAAGAAGQGDGSDDSADNFDLGPVDGGYNEPAPAKPPVYVLADPGWEYVVYFKSGGTVTLDLLEATGTLRQSWYNPRTGQFASQTTIPGGVYKTFVAPDNKDWALYISRR